VDRSKEFYIYPRNIDGSKTGHTICVILRDGEMFSGTALCSPDDNFNYKIGKELAKDRALNSYSKCMDRRSKK